MAVGGMKQVVWLRTDTGRQSSKRVWEYETRRSVVSASVSFFELPDDDARFQAKGMFKIPFKGRVDLAAETRLIDDVNNPVTFSSFVFRDYSKNRTQSWIARDSHLIEYSKSADDSPRLLTLPRLSNARVLSLIQIIPALSVSWVGAQSDYACITAIGANVFGALIQPGQTSQSGELTLTQLTIKVLALSESDYPEVEDRWSSLNWGKAYELTAQFDERRAVLHSVTVKAPIVGSITVELTRFA